jgi:hypothetical protein
MGVLLFKEIPVLPSAFKLDVIICRDLKTVAKFCNKRYGATVEWYEENMHLDSCCALYSTKQSDLKGTLRPLVILEYKKAHIVAHELIHALWKLADCIGYEITIHTEEWQAVLYEYLFTETMKSDYIKLTL